MVDVVEQDRNDSIRRYIVPIVLAIILFPLLRAIYNISPFHPLSSYPGPLLWRASRLSWILSLHSGHLHQRIKEFHHQYGPEVRLAPNEISYTSPQAWRDIYASAPRSSPDGEHAGVLERNPTWFRKMNPSDPWSIMGPDEETHARFRRALMPAFADKALRDYSHVLEDYVDLFIRKLHEKTSNHEPIDLTAWFNFLTFDISGVLTFGESFGSTESGRAHPWVAISCGFGKGVAMMASLNFLGLTSGPFTRLLKFLIPATAREKMVYHKQLTEQKVGSYLESGEQKARAVFIDTALRYNEGIKSQQDTITKPELDINMSILVFAGSETTSSALASILCYLLQNRQCLTTLVHEVRSSFAAATEITTTSTSNLEYLTACISEGLRMGPPVVVGLPRVVPKGGAYICDKLVPAGTFVVVNQHAINRSPSNFHHPNTFSPDRFLPPTNTNMRKENKDNLDAFQPFSIGRHGCIGQRLAWAEMRLVLARLLYAFDIQLVHPNQQDQGGFDFVKQKTFIFWEKEPLMVRLKPAGAGAGGAG